MEGKSGWIRHQQSLVDYEVLSSMVAELMTEYESSLAVDSPVDTPASAHATIGINDTIVDHDWVSLSGLTRVIRHGSSASLSALLNQMPDAVAEEFQVIHCGKLVFSFCNYRWQQRQREELLARTSSSISLPMLCLVELLHYHKVRMTSWQRRYCQSNQGEIDVLSSMLLQVAQADSAESAEPVKAMPRLPDDAITDQFFEEATTSRLMKLA